MTHPDTKIAVVGLAGRFPGANTINSLWTDVIKEGREAIDFFDPGDASDGDDEAVGAYGTLEGAGLFDNEFFDVSPAEAKRMDPQHRLFLEYVWKALEVAGVDIEDYGGYASVYGSCSMNFSYIRDVLEAAEKEDLAGGFSLSVGNSRDYLATRVGYKLDLKGECMTVQTACSSSLVATHLACESLLNGQSGLAVAGGVSVRGSLRSDEERAYRHQEGFILSPDGHCRPFTEAANGTLSGDGVGVVVLKRLRDAIEDGHEIYGTICGTAVNNDGRRKVGYTAPSVDGEVGVMRDALAFSGVDPDEIGYMECHGTGTDIGDAIELRSMKRVFESESTDRSGPLHLGSIKANIGHLDAAAGVSGLIKALLVLYNGEIPPLVHAADHEPHEQLADSEVMTIDAEGSEWERPADHRRKAAVTSLGIGGTNAHAILEEGYYPELEEERGAERPARCLVWSARDGADLEAMTGELGAALSARSSTLDWADVTYTMQTGRADFDSRRIAVADDTSEGGERLVAGRYEDLPDAFEVGEGDVAFLFPGTGALYPGMARDLVDVDSRLEERLEECREIVAEWEDFDLVGLLTGERDAADFHTGHLQAAGVAFEYALAERFEDWGIEPDAVLGSSLGEYTAACVAGALSLEDTLMLAFHRGRLLERVKGGGLLLVDVSFSRIEELVDLGDDVELGLRFAPEDVALSGPPSELERVAGALDDAGVRSTELSVDIAFHSAAIEPIREDFLEVTDAAEFRDPDLPYLSNPTGDWVGREEVDSPEYWYDQMRETVQLGQGLRRLYDSGVRTFLEVGPGRGLSSFTRTNLADSEDFIVSPTLTHADSDEHDWRGVCEAVGKAWMSGAPVDWNAFREPAHRVALPTYPFDRQFFHIDGDRRPGADEAATELLRDDADSGTRGRDTADKTMPRTDLEEEIAEIWSEILGVEPIGVEENFFELGGDSLEATRVVSRIQSRITSEIAIEDVMEHRTIEEVATLVEALRAEEESDREGGDEDEEDYYCAFDLEIAGEKSTVYMTREEFDEEGLPDEAENVRILD